MVSDPATPRDLLELIQARGRAVAAAMRQLITEAQAAGEAAPDDPDQLVIAVMACVDGLGRFSLGDPEHAARHFPAARDWDAMSGYFAPDCIWTLMPPGTTFRGPAEISAFMKSGFGAAAERGQAEIRNEFATDEWGVFEYTSRGVIDAQRAALFAEKIKAAGPVADELAGQSLEGRTFEIPVCFVYHVTASRQIDKVNEYAAMPAFP